MAERIDPLGKRALFWVPGPSEAEERPSGGVPDRTVTRLVPTTGGRRATRVPGRVGAGAPSAPVGDRRPAGASGRGRAGVAARSSATRRNAGALGKRALFSSTATRPADGVLAPAADPPGGRGSHADAPLGWAHVALECATCGQRRVVDLATFARLHVPLFLWRPGAGFTRLMRCPACGHRAWLRASWPATPPPVLDDER